MFHTPIVFIIYRRYQLAEKVFKTISEIKPNRLYVIADGPKNDSVVHDCRKTRAIINKINWNCDVRKNYSEKNMGLRERIITGLDWVFSQEDTAIILEDDCLPDKSFFIFCEELLEYYHGNDRIMQINGTNFQFNNFINNGSYYFSKYAHVWGWATWKRAWKKMHDWDNNKRMALDFNIFTNRKEKIFWKERYDEVIECRMDYTWDYQWSLTCLVNKGLCITPINNLVSNLGFGGEATHTKDPNSILSNMATRKIVFPLAHPAKLEWNQKADNNVAKLFFQKNGLFENIINKLIKPLKIIRRRLLRLKGKFFIHLLY